MPLYASFQPRSSYRTALKDSLLIVAVDGATSAVASITVFSVLGVHPRARGGAPTLCVDRPHGGAARRVRQERGQERALAGVADGPRRRLLALLADCGARQAFVAFPEALSLMGAAAPVFSVAFFAMLFTLGIDSAFALVEVATRCSCRLLGCTA
jgi:SNF family Na+-dependent transporter